MMRLATLIIGLAPLWAQQPAPAPFSISNHRAVYDSQGILQPWTPWRNAIEREVEWYLRCPMENGYPRFVYTTFMDGNYEPIRNRPSFIPATQNGMGIISYLKYYKFSGSRDPRLLRMARSMGDYLVKESNTPDTGKYPRFTRSTGWRARFPQPPDAGSQDDRPYEIEPDKGGLAGYALFELWQATHDERYRDQALHNARVLAANMVEPDSRRGPWPFRADYRTGEGRDLVSGNMSFILRLFDELIGAGYGEFKAPREELWLWIRDFQIPNAAKDGMLWVHFFEDHHEPDNRTSWAPLNLARYLIERREAIDPEWKAHARTLIEFVMRTFTSVDHGVLVCGEQDHDRKPWGGIVSTFGAVLALYSEAAQSGEWKGIAWQAINYTLYGVNDDGCPIDGTWKGSGRGGWQEDAHTDKLHNIVDALSVFEK